MKAGFEPALAFTLGVEGGTADDSHDPGGLTRFGITQATLSRWLKRPAARAEVLALSRATAAAIYRRFYWDAVEGDALPAGLDMAVFDFAVNSGPAAAIMALQKALNIPADGRIGPVTRAALARSNPSALIETLCQHRMGLLRHLPHWISFGLGWSRRVEALRAEALKRCGAPLPPVTVEKKGQSVDQVKSILSSRTIWSNLVGFAALLLPVMGYKTDSLDSGQVVDSVSQIVAGASFIASTFFRIAATKKLAS